jgi:hypothetical protein
VRHPMIIGLLLGLIVYPRLSSGSEFKLIELSELSINYHNYVHPGRSLILNPEPMKEALNVFIKTDLFKYGFMDTKIMSLTTPSQYRTIALDLTLGIRIGTHFEVFYNHMSQHLLDRPHSTYDWFPVNDSIGINIFLYRRDKPSNTIF